MREKWLMAIAVALCAAIPFLQTVSFPFLIGWDDLMILAREENLKLSLHNLLYWFNPASFEMQLIPVTIYTFMADYALAGLNAPLFHAHNILWHIAASLGVLFCFTLFRIRPWLAMLFAIAYAVHPQKAESVAWVIERRDLIFATFAIWSFYFYAKADQGKKFLPLPLLLFTLSILSKPTALVFPAVLLVYEIGLRHGKDWRTILTRIAPFFAIALLIKLVTCPTNLASLVAPGASAETGSKLLIVAHNCPWYVWSFLFPNPNPLYPHVVAASATYWFIGLWWGLGAALLLLLLFKAKDFLLWQGLPLVFCFALSLAPTIGLIRFSNADYADRYNYVPSAFLCFAGAWLLSRLLDWSEEQGTDRHPKEWTKALAVLLALWIAFLGWLGFIHAQAFSSELALYTVASLPEHPNKTAPLHLALERHRAGMPAADELMQKLSSGGELARLQKESPADFATTLRIYTYLKLMESVWENPDSAKERMPKLVQFAKELNGNDGVLRYSFVLTNILNLELSLGREDEALEVVRMIQRQMQVERTLYTKAQDAFYNGLEHYLSKDYTGAIPYLEESLRLAPNSQQARNYLNLSLERRTASEKQKMSN